MNQNINYHYKDLFTKKPRYFILMGGRGAGRSTTASQFALAKLLAPEYFRCAIMRLVLGDIRNSIFQDIRDRMEEAEVEEQIDIKEHLLGFEYGKNKITGIGFRKSSGDQKSKLKSLANFNVIIIEEADEIPEEDFIQLDDSLRTLKADVVIIFLLNPPSKNHWIIKRWFNLIKSGIEGFYKYELKKSVKHNTILINTTYKENIVNMSASSIANYENYKTTRPEHYYNMIKGYVSEGARGRIFKNWKTTTNKIFDELPFPVFYGLDFGFSNDPTALIAIKKHNNKVWFKELIYEAGLTNPLIGKRMGEVGVHQKTAKIYADSAEPKSIQELRDLGWDVIAAEKGPGSVNVGIDNLIAKEVFYTEESTNIAIEEQEYKWALDKDKNPTNTPVDKFNHGMDAERYGIRGDVGESFVGFV